MQFVRVTDQAAMAVGWDLRVLFAAGHGSRPADAALQRLAGLGADVTPAQEVYAALESLIEDPSDYDLFVMDCDAFGGLDAGRRAFAMLGDVVLRVPVILLSAEVTEQVFPEDRRAPTLLRQPLSAVSLRVAFEHALRDRLMWQAA